jgi:hypothetical protein
MLLEVEIPLDAVVILILSVERFGTLPNAET